jgi:hypothetical protein
MPHQINTRMTSNQIHDALIILFENGIEVLHSRAFCWLVFTTLQASAVCAVKAMNVCETQ